MGERLEDVEGIRAAKTSVYAARWLEELSVRSRVLVVPDAGISGYFSSRCHNPRWMVYVVAVVGRAM